VQYENVKGVKMEHINVIQN